MEHQKPSLREVVGYSLNRGCEAAISLTFLYSALLRFAGCSLFLLGGVSEGLQVLDEDPSLPLL